MIDQYSFGRLTFQGKTYSSDLIILPQKIIHPWWRQSGHQLVVADIEAIFSETLEVLIIGTGFFGLMKVAEEVTARAAELNIQLVIDKTGKAVKIFNSFFATKKTAGAFHLTC